MKDDIRVKVVNHSNKDLIGLEGEMISWDEKYALVNLEIPIYQITPDKDKISTTYQMYRFSKDCLQQINNPE